MNTVKRYIPEKVYETIQKLEIKNKEHLYIICDMIYRSTIYKKEDKDYSNKFMDIPKYYFRDLIQDSKSLSITFDILKKEGVIEIDGVYSKESGKALGYRFTDHYISKLISVNVEKKTLSSRIIKNKNERNNLVNETLHKYKDNFLNNFKIDYDRALEYLNNWYNSSIPITNSSYVGGKLNPEVIKILNKYNHIFMSLNAINDGDLYFRKNITNGRVDTNLTSLKSEYKQFIVSTDDLVQVDIINSQPFILSLYLYSSYVGGKYNLDINKKELERFIDWTSAGIFYEMFQRTYFNKTGKTLNRKDIKDIMFCIFYSKNGSYRKEKSIFISVFPDIMKMIEIEKNGKYNEFAIKLQKMESKICIDVICKELDHDDIKYWTIHDAWVVKKEDQKEVIKLIYRSFFKNMKRRPELKIEKINF